MTNRYFPLTFAGFMCAVLVAAAAERPATACLRNYFGQRHIPPHRAENSLARSGLPGDDIYAFLIWDRILSKTEQEDLERRCRFTFGDFQGYNDGYLVFAVHCPRGLRATKALLAREVEFHNLVQIMQEDKITRKIAGLDAFEAGELDTVTGGVFASVVFHRGVPAPCADSIAELYSDTIVHRRPGRAYTLRTRPHVLRELALEPSVLTVAEADMGSYPVNNLSRTTSRVDALQSFNMATTPGTPTLAQYWRPTTALTGEGIRVGVYDTGIDPNHDDFSESDPATGLNVIRQVPGTAAWRNQAHGTHVAGVIASNGWESAANGGSRYQWRGVAPRVDIADFLMPNVSGNAQDVNNHSYALATDGYYTGLDHAADDALHPSGGAVNVMVYAAANCGDQRQHSQQAGYYSVLANAKNPIVVGALFNSEIHQGQPLHADFSSMGPTRDGRIKPDIMAPGGGHYRPRRTDANPMVVRINSIAVLDNAGAVKAQWDFNANTMGWDATERTA